MSDPWNGQDRRLDMINRHEFQSLQQWIKDIDEQLTLHATQEIRMEQRLDSLEEDVKEIKVIVTQLLDIWTQGKGAVKFIGVVISVLAAGWGFIEWAKNHIKF